MSDTLYHHDFLAWTERQAEALRQAAGGGSDLPVDWQNLAEEIESVGRSERREVRSLVRTIISHLLKLSQSPSVENRAGWEAEISYPRTLLQEALEDSPSLRPSLPETVAQEIPRAVRIAGRSLRKYKEHEAAAAVERSTLSISVEEVLDQDWFLPGTSLDWNTASEGE